MDTDVRISRITSPSSPEAALALLSQPVREWFAACHHSPTLPQRLAWPALSSGQNLLLCAPTGSGKTLSAMAPIFSALLAEPGTDAVRCIYLTPLRALCNDLLTKLPRCLEGIGNRMPDTTRKPPAVGLRTGDSSSYRRRKLLDSPPDILLTTPESLAGLLSHPTAEGFLANVRWIVVDEVHSLAGSKRGADLAISLERLAAHARHRQQRVGLSATCAPVEVAAHWLVGGKRPVTLAVAADDRPLQVRLQHMPAEPGRFFATLLEQLLPLFAEHRTTLIFTNTRSLAERLVWLLRRRLPDWADAIAAHHGSLARSLRWNIEQRLQAGEIRIIVSSTSLELGIDIGCVDQVVHIHSPGGAVQLLQRIGRAGHGPKRIRRGVVLTTSAAELTEGLVTVSAGTTAQLEKIAVPRRPLDVLCQQLVGLAAEREWPVAEAWHLVRCAYPFRDLTLADFADCLQYLSGGSRDAKYVPRLALNRHCFGICDYRTARILRRNMGTIATEPIRDVRTRHGVHLGTVNDWFADRLQPGDRFLLAGKTYQLSAAHSHELEVQETGGTPAFTHWEGGHWHAPQELAERLWHFRARAKEVLLDGPDRLHELLQDEYALAPEAAAELTAQFQEQETVSEIPAHGLLVEAVPLTDGNAWLYCLHLPLALPACDALARVLARRLSPDRRIETLAACLGCALILPRGLPLNADSLRELLAADSWERDLEQAMARSAAVQRAFHDAAETGLLVLRQPLGKRRRVGGRNWVGRRLLNWLRFADPKFPLLRQAMREVCNEYGAADTVRNYLEHLARQSIRIRVLPHVSPLAAAWFEAAHDMPESLAMETTIHGQPAPAIVVHREWLLTPFRAAIHLPSATAVIADVHLDYDAARRAGGEAIPEFGWHKVQNRLARLFAAYDIHRLIVAGDLVEDARHWATAREFAGWVAARGVEFVLVPGNHDRGLPEVANVHRSSASYRLAEWFIRHEELPGCGENQVIGHSHPMVRLPRPAACYLVGPRRIVVPAFSDDAAGGDVVNQPRWFGDACFAIIDGEVQPRGRVGQMKTNNLPLGRGMPVGPRKRPAPSPRG